MNDFEELVELLIKKNMTIASAESCTGGLFASKIVDVPDASKVLNASVVTYSNDAKTKYANVNPELIEKYGAVSEEVAMAMAEGIAKETNANVGVSFSGIAGPTGGTPDKPVGTVCIGIYIDGDRHCETLHLNESWSRFEIRTASVDFMAERLLELLP
ncbi:MAG: CinA family protein [Eubacterium sp.]|nr:CinA family protein [Eubacterium sp.]